MKSALLAALLVSGAAAQPATLDKEGGAIGGPTTLHLSGPPGAPYIVLFAFSEAPTTILGTSLELPLDFLEYSNQIPGFLGTLNGAGVASPSFVLPPGVPGLDDLTISFQSVAGLGPFVPSNLVRVTPALPGVFEPALEAPPVPILGGGTAVAPDGTLLFVGGSGPVAQSYDSKTEEWAAAGVSFGVGLLSQTTGLADGRVLFTGGLGTGGQPTNAAALYDPATGQTTTLTMLAARAGHGASLLGNGQVLVTGGTSAFDLTNLLSFFTGILGSCEIFDPATATFLPGPVLLEPRAFHSSTTLSNGQVLIAGGVTLIPFVNLPTVSSTAYRYNPSTGSFGLPAFFSGARFLHSAAALPNGKVLLAGGLTLDLTRFLATLDPTTIVIGTRTDCQVFTPGILGFGTFATVDGLSEGRAGAAIAAVPDGGAVIAGGFSLTIDVANAIFVATATATADRFSLPGSLAPTGGMAAARLFPVGVPLSDGTVMVVGGGPLDAEIYQP